MASTGLSAPPNFRNHVPAARLGVDEIRMAGDPIRIVVVESQQFLADALEALMGRQPDMLVVGILGSIEEFAPLAAEMRPEIMIMDIRLTDEIATAAVGAMLEADSHAKVIFLTSEESDQILLAAIEMGASAILNLSSPAGEVIRVVRAVAEGASLISPQKISKLLNGRRETDVVRDKLTNRETEILGLMAQGASNREIAGRLFISYNTVRCHVRNLSVKLAAHSKLEVLVKAEKLELFDRRGTPSVAFAYERAQNL
jgi:two-component system, NarL family, nitrate/nitrite response regulator NarL